MGLLWRRIFSGRITNLHAIIIFWIFSPLFERSDQEEEWFSILTGSLLKWLDWPGLDQDKARSQGLLSAPSSFLLMQRQGSGVGFLPRRGETWAEGPAPSFGPCPRPPLQVYGEELVVWELPVSICFSVGNLKTEKSLGIVWGSTVWMKCFQSSHRELLVVGNKSCGSPSPHIGISAWVFQAPASPPGPVVY